MKCEKCGMENNDGSKFCSVCGEKIEKKSVDVENNFRTSEPMAENKEKNKTRSGKFVIIALVLACILIPPVGIVCLFVIKKPKNKIARAALVVFLLFYSLVLYIPSDSTSDETDGVQVEDDKKDDREDVGGSREENEDKSGKAKKSGEKEKEIDRSTDKEKNPEEKKTYESGLKKYESGKYLYITKSDLNKYHANMKGAKIYCIINVDDIDTKDGIIQSTLVDGFMMSNFNVKGDISGVSVDDKLAILGVVGGFTDYGAMGKSIDIEKCYVFAQNGDVSQYKKKESDKKLKKYFVITEDVAKSSDDISEKDFKGLCKTYDYEGILRNPDEHDGKYCKLSGSVSQIIEGFFGSYTIYVNDSNGNTWGCTYKYGDGETHLLEGDKVSLYGMLKGTETTSTVLGKQVTMPHLSVEYVEFN